MLPLSVPAGRLPRYLPRPRQRDSGTDPSHATPADHEGLVVDAKGRNVPSVALVISTANMRKLPFPQRPGKLVSI